MKMFAVCLFLILCVGMKEVVSADLSHRLVGGQPAAEGQFPYFAQIGRNIGPFFEPYCGGTLINVRWILTAAQCERLFVAAFDSARLSTQAAGYQTYRISQFVTSLSYTGLGFIPQAPNNIALAQLARPATLTDTVQLATLPTINDCNSMGNFVAIGRGSTSFASFIPSPVINWMQVPRINNTDCAQELRGIVDYSSLIDDTVLCTNGTSNTGSTQSVCYFDMGGPLVVAGTNTVVGVISWTSFCGSGAPSVYTRVCSYATFITSYLPNP